MSRSFLITKLENLSVSELDELIAAASRRREQLALQVPVTEPEGPVIAVNDPNWFVRPMNGGSLLQIRHPGFGWQHYFLPHYSRTDMVKFLCDQIVSHAQVATSPAVNSTTH